MRVEERETKLCLQLWRDFSFFRKKQNKQTNEEELKELIPKPPRCCRRLAPSLLMPLQRCHRDRLS